MSGDEDMEYTVKQLAEIAGVSPRTLRYYDEIGLLKPARFNSSGYRIYEREQVDILQQILFYRELGVNLDKIKAIIYSPDFNEIEALKEHHKKLLKKREQLDLLIKNVSKTILHKERSIEMEDREKFEGFKKNLIEENEKKYGKEVREKYGNDTVERSNKKLMGMTQEDFDRLNKLEEEFMNTLNEAFKTGDPKGELAQKAADLHSQWLCFFWDEYSREAHVGVCQMYIDDERFRDYYDRFQSGTVEFLRDAVLAYTGLDQK